MSEGNPAGSAPAPTPPPPAKVKKVVRYVERAASSGDQPATKKKSDAMGGAATVLVAIAAVAVGLGAAYCVVKFTPFGQRLTGSKPDEKEQ